MKQLGVLRDSSSGSADATQKAEMQGDPSGAREPNDAKTLGRKHTTLGRAGPAPPPSSGWVQQGSSFGIEGSKALQVLAPSPDSASS